MATLFAAHHDLVGDNYAAFIRTAARRFDSFTLQWPFDAALSDGPEAFADELHHYELGREQSMILYRMCDDVVPALLRPGSLFRWLKPAYPEDLAFYLGEGEKTGFTSSSQLQTACIYDAEFARLLPSGLGFAEQTVSEEFLRKVGAST